MDQESKGNIDSEEFSKTPDLQRFGHNIETFSTLPHMSSYLFQEFFHPPSFISVLENIEVRNGGFHGGMTCGEMCRKEADRLQDQQLLTTRLLFMRTDASLRN
ncbi:unnamed protein product [Allacma fusca]|uniref:Uncharacterized protein n=1 Tax=Allacma fusca TaxID=39272 RepID=A0A8J2L5N3_9HEXA|nr:unnamed protein product [Allacma fusca]